MSLERNSFLQFPSGQKLVAKKFSLAELQSRCAARLAVPPSLPNSTSSPQLNGAGSDDDETVDGGALRSRRYSILSCSNDLNYMRWFNEKVLKVSVPPLLEGAPLLLLSPCLSPLLCSSTVSLVCLPHLHHVSFPFCL